MAASVLSQVPTGDSNYYLCVHAVEKHKNLVEKKYLPAIGIWNRQNEK
jgi:hypothetical protein